MKYASWEDMVDAQAIAFAAICSQNERLNELATKADEGYNYMTPSEQNELFSLWEEMSDNSFFSLRCETEWEEMDEQENPIMPDEEPNSWDELECESYHDKYDEWWD